MSNVEAGGEGEDGGRARTEVTVEAVVGCVEGAECRRLITEAGGGLPIIAPIPPI